MAHHWAQCYSLNNWISHWCKVSSFRWTTLMQETRDITGAGYECDFILLYIGYSILVRWKDTTQVYNSGVTQCFFMVFKRVWWWSFRVSTPFSLLCLILLTHFHKNASFRLNCLNMCIHFGKQTKDNIINRMVQCRPTHSFIYSLSCPLSFGEIRGDSSPRRARNNARSTAIPDSSGGSTPRRDQARSEM